MNAVGQKTRLSVVAPAHNEAANVMALHKAVTGAVASLDLDLELIFVDDGSSDSTASVVEELAARDTRVRLIALTRNLGIRPPFGRD